jgi:hypothetical protein
MPSRVVCCDVVVARGERNFSIKKEYYHCGSGVDSFFAGFGDVWTQKNQCNHHFCRSKICAFLVGSACIYNNKQKKKVEMRERRETKAVVKRERREWRFTAL